MRQRLSQLLELRRRAVNFNPGQVGYLERFREECTDVLQMGEKTFGIRVGLATENFIAVDGEPIKKILLLARRLLHESREPGLESLELSRMNFEVRMQTDEI